MYVHLGNGFLIQSSEIIAVFSIKCCNKVKSLKKDDGSFYEKIDLSGKGSVDSIVLTENKMYLSPISSLTLQKRINKNLTYFSGGNNG